MKLVQLIIKYFSVSCCLLIMFFSSTAMAVSSDDLEQLRAQLEVLQKRIAELEQSVSDNQIAVEATAEAIEQRPSGPGGVFDRLSIGGYGELHYNNWNNEGDGGTEQIDYHRFVAFIGYEFTDNLKFFGEVELEHSLAGEGEPGEVELEQAFVEYSFNDYHAAKVGLFLLPVGILNETHEPPTFYGVERNNIENIIIPTTWWAGGVGYTFRHDSGFQFDVAVHEGLEVPNSGSSAGRIRSGRQKTAEANGEGLAMTSRFKYTGFTGLELAATLQYQSEIGDQNSSGLEEGVLYELHAIYNRGPFELRTLYAAWELGTKANAAGRALAARDADSQYGWYIEPSYRVLDNLGLFLRYEDVDGARLRDQFSQWVVGTNFYLHENVVLKMDYFSRDNEDPSDARVSDGFNLGFGFYF